MNQLTSIEEVDTRFAFKASDLGLTGEQTIELYKVALTLVEQARGEIITKIEKLYWCKEHGTMCDHAFDFCGLTDLIIAARTISSDKK